MSRKTKRPTDPNHKATFAYGVKINCSCGWSSGTWFGEGARSNATGEWHWHRDQCAHRGPTTERSQPNG